MYHLIKTKIIGFEHDGLIWQQVSDFKKWESKAAKDYGISFIPQVVIVDAKGNLVVKLKGEDDPEMTRIELSKVLIKLLQEQ